MRKSRIVRIIQRDPSDRRARRRSPWIGFRPISGSRHSSVLARPPHIPYLHPSPSQPHPSHRPRHPARGDPGHSAGDLRLRRGRRLDGRDDRRGARGWLTAAAVNLVMSAHDDPATMHAVLGATLAVPDGQPLVWALRLLGHARATRVYGPDLMAPTARARLRTGTPIYLYGGRSEEALELLADAPVRALPGPAHRGRLVPAVSPAHRRGAGAGGRARSTARAPQVVWVGTGQPKQELWMHEMRPRLGRPATRRRGRRVRLPRRHRLPGAGLDAAEWAGVAVPAHARAETPVAALRLAEPPLRGRLRAPVPAHAAGAGPAGRLSADNLP